MTWIFGPFLVTPCALTSYHAVISKQGDSSGRGSQIQQERNRMETTW